MKESFTYKCVLVFAFELPPRFVEVENKVTLSTYLRGLEETGNGASFPSEPKESDVR